MVEEQGLHFIYYSFVSLCFVNRTLLPSTHAPIASLITGVVDSNVTTLTKGMIPYPVDVVFTDGVEDLDKIFLTTSNLEVQDCAGSGVVSCPHGWHHTCLNRYWTAVRMS